MSSGGGDLWHMPLSFARSCFNKTCVDRCDLFTRSNQTKWKSCYESHIDVDVKKFKLWGYFKNAIFIMKKNKVF